MEDQSNNKLALELDLRQFVEKVIARKWIFLLSVAVCIGLAVAYIIIATPVYRVNTTMLINPSGNSRMLGDSKYLDGGVGLIETEKNLYNEIGIIKSFDLIRETVEELEFGVSYHAREGLKEREYYQYFPFEVALADSSTQIYGIPFQVELLTDRTFRLSIEAEEFTVFRPATATMHEVEESIQFSEVYAFGESIRHKLFNFSLNEPEDQVFLSEFEDKKLFFQLNDLDLVTANYRENLNVEQTDIQSSILSLTSEGPVVRKEADFLSRLTENYINTELLERDKIALSKESFIRDQLSGVAAELAQAEQELENFQRNAKAVDLNQTAYNTLNQAQRLQSELAKLELNNKYLQAQLTMLSDSLTVNKIIAPSVVGIDDPLLSENLLELKRLYATKNRVKYFKGEQSLDLEILNEQIRTTTNALAGNLRNLIQSTEFGISNIESQISGLERVLNELPSNEKRLLGYQRTRALQENLFNYLSQELAKTGIAKAEDVIDTKVLDEPMMVGGGPVAPKKSLILGFAVLAGLILPLGWVILYHSINDNIDNLKEIENFTDIPVAASIVHHGSGKKDSASDPSKWRVDESFHNLSATLQFLNPDPHENVIGITSTIPEEGKSYCAFNLSCSLAQSGKKVLLMDMDFRKPKLVDEKDVTIRPDLFTFLDNGMAPVESLIYAHQHINNLHYIPSGGEAVNPQKLLSSPHLATLISELRQHYDYIIMDSPVLGLVCDYLLINKYVDITLFVVRRKVSKLAFLSELTKLRTRGNLGNLYLVFNDIVGKSFKYGNTRDESLNSIKAGDWEYVLSEAEQAELYSYKG